MILALAAVACAGAAHAQRPEPGETLRRLAAQVDSGRVDSVLVQAQAFHDSVGPRRLVVFTRDDLARPAAELRAAVDSASSAGATDILVDVWTRATVPYFGSAIARADSAIAGADPVGVIAQAASERRVRAWLFLSSGFTTWESPLSRPDEGSFIRSHRGMAAVREDSSTGFADSTAGVWRYGMSPSQLDVHRFLFNMLREAMSRYPVYGVALDGVEFPSDDFSYDAISRNIFVQVQGVDPRGLAKTDLQYLDWAQWRTEQMRVFPSSLFRAMRRTFPACEIAWFVRPTSTRETFLQDWPLAVGRHQISWLAVKPGKRTGAELRTYLTGTPEEANGVPWGLWLDPALPASVLADQVATASSMGGIVFGAPSSAVATSAATWRTRWTPAAPRAADPPKKPAAPSKRPTKGTR